MKLILQVKQNNYPVGLLIGSCKNHVFLFFWLFNTRIRGPSIEKRKYISIYVYPIIILTKKKNGRF